MLKRIFEFSSLTFLSRLLGLARDTLVAYILGAQGLSDVFLAAFRLPNLFRAYFAEGSLSVSFVPLYSQKLVDGRVVADKFANCIFSALLFFLLAFCGLLLVFTPQILKVFTPGFLESPYKFGLTIELARIMLPYLFFISLASVIGGILQTHDCFFVTAVSPIILNLCIIVSALMPHLVLPVYYFSVAISLAALCQFILAFCIFRSKGMGIKITWPKIDHDMKVFLKRALMSVLSGCMTQISIWLNIIFASFIPGAISYIYYADRVNQLPQALIGISMSTVLLPSIAKLAREGDTKRMIEAQNEALDLGMTLIVPAAATLVAVPDAVLLSLLNYGQFDYWAIGNTVPVLSTLATSLPAFVVSKILLLFFYTRGKFGIPALFSVISLVVNAFLNHILMKFHGHVGIAISSSVASWVNAVLLVVYLQRHDLYKVSDKLNLKLAYVFFSTTVMVMVLSMAKTLLEPFFFQGVLVKIASLVIIVTLGVFVYFSMLFVIFKQKVAVE